MSSIHANSQRRSRSAALLSAGVLAALYAARASADVLPPDICNVEGASCQNAGGSGASSGVAGVCVTSTCTSWFPVYLDAGSQGGSGGGVTFERHDYPCLRCVTGQPHDAGASAGASGNISDAGPSIGSEENDQGCGCGLPGARREGSLAALMLGLGALALRAGRSKRR